MQVRTKHWNSLICNKSIKIYQSVQRRIVLNDEEEMSITFSTQDVCSHCGTIATVEPCLVFNKKVYKDIQQNWFISKAFTKEIL